MNIVMYFPLIFALTASYWMPCQGQGPCQLAESEKIMAIQVHNDERRMSKAKGAPALKWSEALATEASKSIRGCPMSHYGSRVIASPGKAENSHLGFIENCNMQEGGNRVCTKQIFIKCRDYSANVLSRALTEWTDEKYLPAYNATSGSCKGSRCRRYEQMVKPEVKWVGCAVESCIAKYQVACQYSDAPMNN